MINKLIPHQETKQLMVSDSAEQRQGGFLNSLLYFKHIYEYGYIPVKIREGNVSAYDVTYKVEISSRAMLALLRSDTMDKLVDSIKNFMPKNDYLDILQVTCQAFPELKIYLAVIDMTNPDNHERYWVAIPMIDPEDIPAVVRVALGVDIMDRT